MDFDRGAELMAMVQRNENELTGKKWDSCRPNETLQFEGGEADTKKQQNGMEAVM